MNIIKSDEWELLSNIVKREESSTLNIIFDFLAEETLRYENGEAHYPKIDFAITIALDRKAEKKKQQERILQELKFTKSTPPVEIKPNSPVTSPSTRKKNIRDSWINKFDPIISVPEPEPIIPVPDPVPDPVSEPIIISDPDPVPKKFIKRVRKKPELKPIIVEQQISTEKVSKTKKEKVPKIDKEEKVKKTRKKVVKEKESS